MRSAGKVFVCLLLPLLVGCYRYVPVATPEVGREIRAQLNEQGASALTSQLGPGVLELDGLLLRSESGSYSVVVETYLTRQQGELSGGNKALSVPLDHVGRVEEKRLDPLRSVALGAVLVGGAFAMVRIFGPDGLLFEDPDPDPPGPVELVVPAFQLGGVTFGLGARRQ